MNARDPNARDPEGPEHGHRVTMPPDESDEKFVRYWKLATARPRRERFWRLMLAVLPMIGLFFSGIALSFQCNALNSAADALQRKDLPKRTKDSIHSVQRRMLTQDTRNPDHTLATHLGFVNLLRNIFIVANIDFVERDNWARDVTGMNGEDPGYYGNDFDKLGPYIVISGADRGDSNDELEDLIATFDASQSIHLYVNLGWAKNDAGVYSLQLKPPLDAVPDTSKSEHQMTQIAKPGSSYRMVRMELQFFHPYLLDRYWDDLVYADVSNPLIRRQFAAKLEQIGLIAFPIRWRSYYPAPGKKDFLLQYTMYNGIPTCCFEDADKINKMVWGDMFELKRGDQQTMGPSLPTDDAKNIAEEERQKNREATEIGTRFLRYLESLRR